MLRAVTFDATGTLLHSPRRGEIYAEILERHGVAVTPAEAERLITLVWQELACSADPAFDRFAAHPEGPRGWWARFLERLCEHLGAPPPSRFAAAELYHRFATAEAWEVYPEVPAVLENLRARDLKLAVIANWDDRLPPLLAALDLADSFEVVVTSFQVGAEKPDQRIFAFALDRLSVPSFNTLHIGDRQLEDVEGAEAAGLHAVHLNRADHNLSSLLLSKATTGRAQWGAARGNL
ncbi:MAG TPA: HAD-IA family hydrolase [Thermoanaerobaculia bacterium]|nr:HAD-IA family hydrolase [Thermoanaerobaculia bacterium]